jgi:histidinol-phosphate aminotransferase
VLGPDLFWDTTTQFALRQGGELKRTPKTDDLGIDLDALYDAITPDVAMVQICNPNNPTGMVLPADQLRAFCLKASQKCTVLVDEAYNEITDDPAGNSMIDLVRAGHDVVVARTFSKIYGMAGMRVGYMMATPETTEKMRRFSDGNYNLNQAGVAGAVASLNDDAFVAYSRSKIVEAREMITDAVAANGLTAAPSSTSFVFVNLGDINAEQFRAAMAARNIMIRGIYQDYTSWSRVSAGRLEDVAQYVAALPPVLEALRKGG